MADLAPAKNHTTKNMCFVIACTVVTILVSIAAFHLHYVNREEVVVEKVTRNHMQAYNTKRAHHKNIMPRKIWLVWWSGWENAPPLCRGVLQSWKDHNPNWEVIALDSQNTHTYLPSVKQLLAKRPLISIQAQSDFMRLHLMQSYGGVWADATMLCMRPLDDWVWVAMAPSDIWMYHGRDWARGPASWFMVAAPRSYIFEVWVKTTDELWLNDHENVHPLRPLWLDQSFDWLRENLRLNYPPDPNTIMRNYVWMDQLFGIIIRQDRKFLDLWRRVPFLDCNRWGQSHSFAGKVAMYTEDLLEFVRVNPPFAIKLSHHEKLKLSPDVPHENAQALLQISKAWVNRTAPAVVWGEAPPMDETNWFFP